MQKWTSQSPYEYLKYDTGKCHLLFTNREIINCFMNMKCFSFVLDFKFLTYLYNYNFGLNKINGNIWSNTHQICFDTQSILPYSLSLVDFNSIQGTHFSAILFHLHWAPLKILDLPLSANESPVLPLSINCADGNRPQIRRNSRQLRNVISYLDANRKEKGM